VLLSSITAVCVDPAKYLPKPKTANLKVVQMNLIMCLAAIGLPITHLIPNRGTLHATAFGCCAVHLWFLPFTLPTEKSNQHKK